MNRQLETAGPRHRFPGARGVLDVLIGGLAVQRRGESRFTREADLTLLHPPGRDESLLRALVPAFPAHLGDAVVFALEQRLLPVTAPGGSEADIRLGRPGDDEEVMARAVPFDLGEGREGGGPVRADPGGARR